MLEKIFKKIFFFILCLSFFVFYPVYAQGLKNAVNEANSAANIAGVKTEGNVEDMIANLVSAALSLIGVFFLILMIYGGYIWMLARGNETEAEKAKGIITMGLIGVVIVIIAYAVSNFVIDKLIGIGGA